MLYDGRDMIDDEFLSNFRMNRACIHQLKELVKDDKFFSTVGVSGTSGPSCCTSYYFSNT